MCVAENRDCLSSPSLVLSRILGDTRKENKGKCYHIWKLSMFSWPETRLCVTFVGLESTGMFLQLSHPPFHQFSWKLVREYFGKASFRFRMTQNFLRTWTGLLEKVLLTALHHSIKLISLLIRKSLDGAIPFIINRVYSNLTSLWATDLKLFGAVTSIHSPCPTKFCRQTRFLSTNWLETYCYRTVTIVETISHEVFYKSHGNM